jgi:hypothetical protein
MFLALFFASALQNPGPVAAANAPAITVAATTAATPLREVVYKVSFTRRLNVSQETYGGSVQDPNASGTVVSQAPPFAQAGSDATDSGTVTVDVMQVASDALGIRVTESWTGSTPSATYLGNVTPDGSINFAGGQLNECTRAILEYFGADVMNDQPANTGVAWTRVAKSTSGDITTNYSVGSIEGALADIHEQTTIKSKSVAFIDSVTTTDLKYKPAELVPISGQVVMHASQTGASSVTNVTTIGNFVRVSDTRDKGQ